MNRVVAKGDLSHSLTAGIRGLALLAAAALASCGDAPHDEAPGTDGAPLLERLDLHPLDRRAAPTASTLQLFEPARELDEWTLEATRVQVRKVGEDADPSAPDGGGHAPLVATLRAAVGEPPLVMERRGTYDPATFNRVRVVLSFRGAGWMRAEVLRSGRVVMVSPVTQLQQNAEHYTVDLDVLHVDSTLGTGDTLRLSVSGNNRTLGLVLVELQDAPLGSRLPDAGSAPRMITIGSEGRTGEGLVSGRRLSARFRAPPGGRLGFSWGQPETVRPLSARATLVATLTDADGTTVRTLEREIPGKETGWSREVLDLAAFSGRDLALNVDLVVDGDGEAACAVAEVAVFRPGTPPPAVLLITTDTHRGDHLGAAGRGVVIDTPTLDGLAARGVLFEDCFAPTNSTNPSHVALMTGLHPRDTGIVVNHRPASDAAETLAEAYRDAGWLTFASLSTKHLGHLGSGLGQGFDRMNWPSNKPRDAETTIDVLESWLPEAEGQPVFVWLHVFDAHWPYEPPKSFDRRYYPRDRDPRAPLPPGVEPAVDPAVLPSDLTDVTDLEFPRAQYRAEISYLDEQLGRLVRHERFVDGIVAVVGDHGESLGEGDVFFDHAEITPGTLHIPLIVSWPGGPRGVRVPDSVTHLDLARTLLDLSGMDETPFPGRNLRGFVEGRGTSAPRFQLSASGHAASLQHGDLYLVLTLQPHQYKTSRRGYELHQVELYDLSTDRALLDDLVDERPDDAAELRARLIEWMKGARNTGIASAAIEDPELVAQLAALGYAEHDPNAGTSSLWIEDDCDWCRRFE